MKFLVFCGLASILSLYCGHPILSALFLILGILPGLLFFGVIAVTLFLALIVGLLE